MFEGVGRRHAETGTLVSIGAHSLNGNERKILFRNNGDGTFTDVAWVNAADRNEDGRGLSIFDYDRDGQLDIVLRNFLQPAHLLHNLGGRAHWLQVKLVGTRSNRDAVGARLRLATSHGWQTRWVTAGSGYLSGQSLVQHFGLGDAARAQVLHVFWPSGLESELHDLAADHRYLLIEGEDRIVSQDEDRVVAEGGDRIVTR